MLKSKFLFQFHEKQVQFIITMILICICGCAAGLSSEQKAIVKELYISTHELPNHARRVSISPEGILEVETTRSQDAYDEGNGSRTLIDVRSGSQIWSGPLRVGHMLTDTPSPIIVETADRKHTVSRYDRNGSVVWQIAHDGLFVFGLAQEDQGMLLTLSLGQANDESVQAVLHGITLMDGKNRWRTELGKVSMSDHEIGSLWRYQDRPIFGHRGRAFLLLENRAFCIAVADGRVLSNKPIPLDSKVNGRGNLIWLPDEEDVIVVSGPHVFRLSDRADRQWYANLGENKAATGALLMDQDLVIAFNGKAERGVAILDAKTATWRWRSSVKASDGAHPKGVAVLGGSVVVASVGRLHGFARETGNTLFSEAISKQLLMLFNHDGGIVLTGSKSIERRSSTDGSLFWRKGDLDPPLAWFYKQRGSSMAAVKASLQASATISANQSRWYYNQAGQKTGGSYAYDPFTRYQYTKLGSAAGASAAASNFSTSLVGTAGSSASMIDRKVSIIVDMQSSEPLNDRAYFLVPVETRVLTGQTNTAKLLVVNLADGSTNEIPVRKAPMTCIPAVMVNERLGLIIQAYHKFPFCKASRTIDILRLPTTSSKGESP
ncbi:MAG: hypothetical protein BBJ60_01430 [Desulfobacterales bacterium S7086C20]|nr:MAG: hypothetical protein BBJ60_01430 [Desulfobacterales bacterium S7086C20]